MQKIEIELPNRSKLVAEGSSDREYKEIFIRIVTKDGMWKQDLAIVGANYHYDDENEVIIDDGSFSVKVFADENNEDFTDDFNINEYPSDAL